MSLGPCGGLEPERAKLLVIGAAIFSVSGDEGTQGLGAAVFSFFRGIAAHNECRRTLDHNSKLPGERIWFSLVRHLLFQTAMLR